jgi:hypothetical protein
MIVPRISAAYARRRREIGVTPAPEISVAIG